MTISLNNNTVKIDGGADAFGHYIVRQALLSCEDSIKIRIQKSFDGKFNVSF